MINNGAEYNFIGAGTNYFCAGFRKKRATFITMLILALYFFYYVYRYILRYNSTDTSPTYNNTPVFLQLLKYVILAVFIAALFLALINSKVYKRKSTVLLLIFMTLQSVYSLIVARNEDDAVFILCSCPAILILIASEEIDVKRIDKLCEFAMKVAVVYELVQIVLYIVSGRLTALAYDTGVITDVRFGSMWDDPNGFAILLSFFIPYAFCKYRSFKRVIYLALLTLFLILTWSLTGIFAFAAVVFLLFLRRIFLDKNKMRAIVRISVIVLVLLAVVITVFLLAKGKILYFISSKLGSMQGHLESFDLSRISLFTFLGIAPSNRFVEAGIIGLILHGGIIMLLVFYWWGFKTLSAGRCLLRRENKDGTRYPMYCGMYCYIIGFLIANINLPVIYIFSNMGIYMLFAALLINNSRFAQCSKSSENTFKDVNFLAAR